MYTALLSTSLTLSTYLRKRLENDPVLGLLFDPAQGVAVLVVHFLALLELARENLVEVTQAEPYAPLYVRLAYVPS